MTKTALTTRVLALRADGFSFRAIEGKLLKAFGITKAGNGFRAFRVVQLAAAAKSGAARKSAKAKAKKTAGKPAAAIANRKPNVSGLMATAKARKAAAKAKKSNAVAPVVAPVVA